MNIRFFCVFHKSVHKQIYLCSPEETKRYITYYGVHQKDATIENSVYEYELPKYNPAFQNLKYNEGSCIYHVYENQLYNPYDYIGFCQYDMVFNPNVFRNIETRIGQYPNTIFYMDFFEWAFIGGQKTIIRDFPNVPSGLKSYNAFFGREYTEQTLKRNRMMICNTFLIPKQIYIKLMSWLSQYFREDINRCMVDTECDCDFDPGHMIEALTGMFLALEISEGATYCKLDIEHKNIYKESPVVYNSPVLNAYVPPSITRTFHIGSHK